MSESAIQARIMLAVGARPDVRVFRNTCGTGWQGEVVSNAGGLVVLRNARFTRFGLQPGSADLIGWQRRLITGADVGSEMAVFLSLEIKAGKGVQSDEQKIWQRVVAAAGGVAGVARSPEEAIRLLGDNT